MHEKDKKLYIDVNKAFKNAFQQENQNLQSDEKNSAITSSFVAGKSTVIYSYLKKNYIKKETCEHVQMGKEQRQMLENGGFDALYFLVFESYIEQDFMRYRPIFPEGGILSHDNHYIRNIA